MDYFEKTREYIPGSEKSWEEGNLRPTVICGRCGCTVHRSYFVESGHSLAYLTCANCDRKVYTTLRFSNKHNEVFEVKDLVELWEEKYPSQ